MKESLVTRRTLTIHNGLIKKLQRLFWIEVPVKYSLQICELRDGIGTQQPQKLLRKSIAILLLSIAHQSSQLFPWQHVKDCLPFSQAITSAKAVILLESFSLSSFWSVKRKNFKWKYFQRLSYCVIFYYRWNSKSEQKSRWLKLIYKCFLNTTHSYFKICDWEKYVSI